MTSRQFYGGRILDPSASSIVLEGKEHHHLARVARIRTGDEVWLFDDDGRRILARVESVEKMFTRLCPIRKAEEESPRLRITLGQAVIKPKNMDLIVQKATELGISAFVPLVTSRSLQGRAESGEGRIERWRKIARESAKQSERSAAPVIESLQPLAEFLGKNMRGRKLFLSEGGGRLLRDVLISGLDQSLFPEDVVLLTGPEGGWAAEETEALESAGIQPVSLGRTIVRAETAALCAVGMISHFWNL